MASRESLPDADEPSCGSGRASQRNLHKKDTTPGPPAPAFSFSSFFFFSFPKPNHSNPSMTPIGIDMGKRSFYASVGGQAAREFRNTEEGVEAFLASLRAHGVAR